MKLSRNRATLLVAGLAVVVSLGGAAAVQAQTVKTSGTSGAVGAGATAVSNHGDRFGFGPGQALLVKDVIKDGLGTVIRYDRTYRGLPVVGGDFVVHLDKQGAFRYGNGRKVVGLPANVKPGISAAVAREAAVSALGYRTAKVQTKLVVFTTARSSTLAWQVTTQGKVSANGDVSYIDARNGHKLASWSTVMTDGGDYAGSRDVGTGHTLWVGKVNLPDVKRHAGVTRWVLKDRTRGVQKIYDANNTSSQGVGTLFKDEDNVWGDGTTANRESAAADAAYGLANTWDFYLNTFHRDGIADDGKAGRGFVHFGNGYRNAFWSDGCFCMEFGDGSGDWGPLVTLDVAGHEMSHGVTSRTAGLIYAGESGGLNESTSDVMGTMVEFYANNKNDVPDYIIGEQFQIPYDPDTNWLRRMDKPSLDGGSADCWYDGVGQRNVHYSSGVGNHAFYLLSEGSGKKTINGIDYDSPTCDGSTVKGIGQDKAAAIWYKALTEQWVSTTNYHMARDGMLKAAEDLYGKNSTEYKTTDAAWAAVDVS